MSLEVEDILERVERTEGDRAAYYELAEQWEKMWMLQAFKETPEAALKEGREQLVFPDPYNVVNLALRLLSNQPTIEVPSESVTDEKDDNAEARQKFLAGLWHRSNREQRRNVIKDAAWYGAVRGRFVFDVRWIRDQLPKRQQKKRLPILVRALDPLTVGFKYGPLGPMWCYHKYESERIEALQKWPELDLPDRRPQYGSAAEDVILDVIDYWWIDQKTGDVWNAVLVDDQFAISPNKTPYPDLPMLEGFCDSAPTMDETSRGLSILHALNGNWQYKCKLGSQIASGMLWYFWPFVTVENELGMEVPDFEVKPGVTQHVPRGTKVSFIMPEPNIPLAQSLMGMLDTANQQSTFPGVMYGEGQGQMQSGYGVSLLADAAKGRINGLRESMEWAVTTVNEIALALVEEFAGKEGVAIYGYDEGRDGLVEVKVTPENINGYHENYVRLTTNLPQDDMQKLISSMRMVQDGLISKRTWRTRFAGITLPSDEEQRIQVEMVLASDELKQMGLDHVMTNYFGAGWRKQLGMEPPPPPPQQQGLPPGPPPGMMPPPQGGPPMMPPGMGPPPGMLPPGPPPMMPPGMGPQGMQPPSMMPGGMAGMPALPPDVQAQFTPEGLGMPPNPAMFDAMMGVPPGQGVSDDELRRAAAGLPA